MKILLTHSPEARELYYGARALAGLRELGEVKLHEGASPLEGEAPTIDLAVGYSKANTSPILKLFLSRIDDLTAPIPTSLAK